MDTTNQSINRSLERRQRMADTLLTAIEQSPQEMQVLLKTIGDVYQTGQVPRLWDVIAILAGSDRGYGADWYFTALELQRQKEKREVKS